MSRNVGLVKVLISAAEIDAYRKAVDFRSIIRVRSTPGRRLGRLSIGRTPQKSMITQSGVPASGNVIVSTRPSFRCERPALRWDLPLNFRLFMAALYQPRAGAMTLSADGATRPRPQLRMRWRTTATSSRCGSILMDRDFQ